MTPRVYLAGPDVFHPDHARIFAGYQLICRRYGLKPLVPFDNKTPTAADIYRSNVRLLDSCDAVIANITPFRGPHCDVGTAWEIGYAIARGAPVFAFSEATESLFKRVRGGKPSVRVDVRGMFVEDFDLPENLMVVMGLVGSKVHATFEAAVEAAARHLGAGRKTVSS